MGACGLRSWHTSGLGGGGEVKGDTLLMIITILGGESVCGRGSFSIVLALFWHNLEKRAHFWHFLMKTYCYDTLFLKKTAFALDIFLSFPVVLYSGLRGG